MRDCIRGVLLNVGMRHCILYHVQCLLVLYTAEHCAGAGRRWRSITNDQGLTTPPVSLTPSLPLSVSHSPSPRPLLFIALQKKEAADSREDHLAIFCPVVQCPGPHALTKSHAQRQAGEHGLYIGHGIV